MKMRKSSVLLLTLLLALAGCSGESKGRKTIDFDSLDDNGYVQPGSNTNEIGSFDLTAPFDGVVVNETPAFSWTAAEHADKYTLEVCSHQSFVDDNSMIDYYIQKNIVGTSWAPSVVLQFRDKTYYWRVTASNDTETRVSSVFTFYMEAPEVEEFPFDLGEADDWTLHPLGSYADVSIDRNNFFGNNEDSLMISFKKEDTMRGIPESDGWIIVTKTIEKSIYGTDALLFDMYYAGQDATIIIRLIDRDNEFWYVPIKVSTNAKQSVIVKFSDFIQRTKDVTVGNGVFDYERIKYFEVVFERSFGDGIMLLSGAKAIKFSNYKNFFIEKLDFTSYEDNQWVYESYEFETIKTEDELTLKYYNSATEEHGKINGYGFAKINVNQYFYSGDAVKISLKYTGSTGDKGNIIIRIYEEDTDRWAYQIPYTQLTEGEYKTFVIPFKAFAKSSIAGDGKRQFYRLLNLQFGCNNQYGTGTISFKDFEVVYCDDYRTEERRVIGSDGLIENFDSYQYTTDLYFIWTETEENKDEYMALNTANKTGGSSNIACGRFEYKCDMSPAKYLIPVSTTSVYSSFSIEFKDASMKTEDPRFSHITNWAAETYIFIHLKSGEIYNYGLGNLGRFWTRYVIPFASFTLTNPEISNFPLPITGSNIDYIGFSFQYFYYDYMGTPHPLYLDDNPVYIDNIYLGSETEYSEEIIDKIIHMDGNEALVDDFEDYETDEDVKAAWTNGREYEYQNAKLSSNVSSEGGNKSISLQFRSNENSPSYVLYPTVDPSIEARGARFSLYCEKAAEVYFNLYLLLGGNTVQYRATISAINVGQWTEYTVGLDHFSVVGGTARPFTKNDIKYLSRVTFGMVYSDGLHADYELLVDNIVLDLSLDYDVNTRRVIE